MIHPVTLVVTAKYEDVFRPLVESVGRLRPGCYHHIVVRDSWNVSGPSGWTVLDGEVPFRMARSANRGWRAAINLETDILYCGDDIRFTHPRTVERLQEVAYSSKPIGLVAPRLKGRSSVAMSKTEGYMADIIPMGFWFPCIYIKRSTIDTVGYLDERFTSFCDDLDYSTRVVLAGLRLVCTSYVSVIHESGPGHNQPTTFSRTTQDTDALRSESYKLFSDKYGLSHDQFLLYAKTGDTSLLCK